MRRWFYVCLAIVVALLPRAAAAQAPPELSASIEPSDVEVGEPFNVVLSASTDSSGAQVTDPRLPLPSGLRASPPSISSQTQISFINGRLIRKSGISATWQLAASREGVYAIGPPSVSYNGQRIGANPLRVTVHPAGSGSGRRRPSRGPSPFDPFGMFPRMPGGLFQPQDLTPPEEQTDPSLQVDAAPDARVFLRSVVDQKTAVVGEQVTLTIFLYTRVPIEQTELHEPSVADFFRRDFLGPNTQERAQNVSINGVLWRAQVVYKSALFPLRSGELEIGPMQESFVGGGAIGTMVRQSQPIRLHVSEPPASGRPVGYQVGDVGNYALSAVVEPRTSEVGGAIAVTITLGGVGNVPTQVRVPANSSMEWLEPQVRETIDIENGKVRGSRTFSYVVRPKTAGSLELGAVTLPYWDPDRKLYDIARVGLGKITVTAADKPIAGKEPSAPHDPWSALAAPREQLGAFQRPREPLTDRPFYWFGLFGAPLAVVAGSLGARGARGANRYLKKRRSSKERGIDEALSQARAALGKRDAGEVASQLERALYLALERATDLKARGVLRVELAPELERRGVPADLAAESAALLSALETSRFAPEGAAEHRELVERVASAVKRLHRIVPPTAKVEQE